MTQKIKIACPDCGATVLYKGFAERAGEAVVCLGCSGKGWKMFQYQPFEGRKKKSGIKVIRFSRGSFIATGVGGQGEAMDYAQFEKAIPQ
jgi:hypothetical protein